MSHKININTKYTKENHHTFKCSVNIVPFFNAKAVIFTLILTLNIFLYERYKELTL